MAGMAGTADLRAEVAPTTAATTPAAVTVPVRVGTHQDFDRIVFDWPRDVTYATHHEGGAQTLTFSSAATLALPREALAKLSRAKGVSVHNDDANHVSVTFATAPDALVKVFTSGTSVVVDVSGKTAPQPVPTQDARQASPLTAPVPAPVAVPAAVPVAAPAPNAAPTVAVAGQTLAAAAPLSTAAPLSPALTAPALTPPTTDNPITETATGAPQALTPAAQTPAPALGTKTKAVLDQVKNALGKNSKPTAYASASNVLASSGTPNSALPTAAPSGASAALPPVAATASTVPSKLPDLTDTPVLIASLDPHVPIRTAVYSRANVGYIIFERKLTLSADALAGNIPLRTDLQPLNLPQNSGFRFPMPPRAELHATRDGTAWKIFISKQHAQIAVTTTLVAQPDFALGPRFLLPLPDAPEPVLLTDPVVGDNLIVIPLGQSEAFSANRHMADFNIIAAAQGLVLKPLSDKIAVHAVSDGIEITTEGGLHMSRAIDTGTSQQSSGKARAAAAGKSIFNFAIWSGKKKENFTQTRQRLQQNIVDVPEVERNRARLELARFYFANGNGLEALGLLNMLAKDVPDLHTHGDFIALMGAADILAERPDEGLAELNNPLLAGQPEIELWQAIAYAQQRDWVNAEEKFSVAEPILSAYPEPFFSRFMVLAIEAAFATGKDHEAIDWLNYLTSSPHQDRIAPALAYLRGVMNVKNNRITAAQDAWKEAQLSTDQLSKVRAELALIDLGVSTHSLTPAQAADRLESLRFAWRGDDLEVDILRRLGQFYIQARNIKTGLNTLSQAVTLYPTSSMAPSIRAEMATIFHDVFLSEMGKKLSPLDTLTLYQQYRDLMPVGKDGDAIMRNLSERLVAIDLLDQAASILEDLTRNHLQGDEKIKAALRLAAIRLLDHKADAAMSALDITGTDPLPGGEQLERTLLRARALSELQRTNDALALLKDNTAPGARMLHADIAMRTQDWSNAAQALMDLVGPPPPTGRLLSDDKINWLINAAVAFSLAQDQVNLDKLAIDYSASMATTPQNTTFRMLTQPEKGSQLRDLAAAQSQISQVDLFQTFLNNYRQAPADVSAATSKKQLP